MSQENDKDFVKKDRMDIHIEDLELFANEFKGDNDRSSVILGAAKIDYLLYQLLQKYLLPNPSGNDELLEGDSPLGTFSSRINICFRLGLLSASMAKSLHLIRKIRNGFAHEASSQSLNTGSHRDRVNEFVRPIENSSLFKILLVRYFGSSMDPSARFRAGVALITFRLALWCDYIEPINNYKPLDFESSIKGAT